MAGLSRRRVAVPDREALHARLRAVNERTLPIAVGVGVATALGLAFFRWSLWWSAPVPLLIVTGLVLGGAAQALLPTLGLVKLRVEDLAPDRQLGGYDRDQLLALLGRAHAALQTDPAMPAWLVRDKSLNAAALMTGLGWLAPALDAIFINRQALHVLPPDELLSVIGHEIGHHIHRVWVQSMMPLHLAAQVVLGWYGVWAATALFGPQGEIYGAILAGLSLIWGYAWAKGVIIGDHAVPIEFLCDEAGAIAAGVRAAVHAELRLARDHESAYERFERLRARAKGRVSLARIAAIYDRIQTWGTLTDAELDRRFDVALREKILDNGQLSVAGFWAYLTDADDDDDAPAEDPVADALAAVDVLDWPRDALDGDGLTDAEVDALCDALEANPDRLLVRSAIELVPQVGTHPNASRRVLYLWRHRDAIEADRLAWNSGNAAGT